MGSPDWSGFHGQFAKESLAVLKQSLETILVPLLVYKKECINVIQHIQKHYNIASVYAHEET